MPQELTPAEESGGRITTRQVRVMMRDGRRLAGAIYVAEGQTLTRFLATRKTFLNLTGVEAGWIGELEEEEAAAGEEARHLTVRMAKVLWVQPEDRTIPLVSLPAMPTPRPVELFLEKNSTMRGQLHMGVDERLSDYLQTTLPFLPLYRATQHPSGRSLGDIALNAAAVVAARETGRDAWLR
jgi:hypothetical protein